MVTPLPAHANVTLDCSRPPSDKEGRLASFDQLLQWVERCPHRRGVHVYVRTPSRDPEGRRFKNALQAMGCTVTARASISCVC